jgi:methyl-accepting chemotaxis protein
LTIELPDGTESVSEAILSNRQMLLDPDESAMASETEVVELTDWVEELAGKIADVEQHQTETIEADVTDLETVVEEQRRQIEELRGAVESLADILGTTADWETFDE